MACEHTNEVNVNATINILRAGHARLTCQVSDKGMPPAIGTTENGGVAAAFGIFVLQVGGSHIASKTRRSTVIRYRFAFNGAIYVREEVVM